MPKNLFLNLSLFCLPFIAGAQVTAINSNGSKTNAITTAVPFLTISPDARSGGMGEAGVALSPDANAAYWNPAKLAFVTDQSNAALSYSPWMRQIYPDVNLAYLSYFKRLSDRNTIGGSLRYFNLGPVDSYDSNLNSLGTIRPNEFSFDVSVARKFGERLSMGLTGRYISSNLTQGVVAEGQQNSVSKAFAADVSLYYNTANSRLTDEGNFAFGIDISNIGTKMNYTITGPGYFLPTNLKIGVAQTIAIDNFNKITFALDMNKLLVPTPPQRDANGNIIAGREDNVSVVNGIFGSFTGAPGGFNEELQELSFAGGVEYWYDHTIALRMGYFYENPNKGDRRYVTFGTGFRLDNIDLDLSYIAGRESTTPLANVLRFSLAYSFGKAK